MMVEPTLLPVKPGSISKEDKAMLSEAGILVIEHDEPETIKLLRPMADLDSSEMLVCAMRALSSQEHSSIGVQALFTRLLNAALATKKIHGQNDGDNHGMRPMR